MKRLTRRDLADVNGKQIVLCDSKEEDCNDSCLYRRCKWNEKALQKLKEYEDAEEQGLLLIEPCDVEDIIDKLFSHNERVSLWVNVKEEITYHQLIWSGMAWDIPEVFKSCYFVKIFGTIPEKITQADIINIEVVLTKEAEQALARMEKENG